MITPTVGRIVWFTPAHNDNDLARHGTGPLAAIVTHVWGDRCVNLAVFDSNANQSSVTSVMLLQDDDEKPESGRFATWMPFQIGQAKKHQNEAASASAA